MYWVPDRLLPSNAASWGECHRHAPVPAMGPVLGHSNTHWPQTPPTNGCGDYEARKTDGEQT